MLWHEQQPICLNEAAMAESLQHKEKNQKYFCWTGVADLEVERSGRQIPAENAKSFLGSYSKG